MSSAQVKLNTVFGFIFNVVGPSTAFKYRKSKKLLFSKRNKYNSGWTMHES